MDTLFMCEELNRKKLCMNYSALLLWTDNLIWNHDYAIILYALFESKVKNKKSKMVNRIKN